MSFPLTQWSEIDFQHLDKTFFSNTMPMLPDLSFVLNVKFRTQKKQPNQHNAGAIVELISFSLWRGGCQIQRAMAKASHPVLP